MDKKGFTLIEVIIAVALLGIITIITLSLFSTTFLNIVRFGDLTEVVVENQATIENLIGNKSYGGSVPDQSVNVYTNSAMQFTPIINGVSQTDVTVNGGFYLEVEKEDTIIRTFTVGD